MNTNPVQSKMIPDTFEKCVERYRGVSDTTQKVIDAFGGLEPFCKISYLPWKEKFSSMGGHYIDNMEPSDVTAPVMRGEDRWGRPFVTVKTKQCGEKSGDFTMKPEHTKGIETLFQRYSDDQTCWVSGSHHTHCRVDVGSIRDNPAAFASFLQEGKSFPAYCYGGTYQTEVQLDQ